ncbi:hypothetical protein QBC34DRAFT_304574 [Podospora aff. communis PSN243]|uniref:Uncharacterized protein n=1 Tax=Podospora aff. communis PSN243 TaxID=3040156 RepID=A0AAV9GE38_9PEZI|nr:hypothetical protein QBC34DRAFT_304574 [Podospora aff. communis PSN243]
MKIALTLSLLSLPITVYSAVGGRCSSFWRNTGCICLDRTVCERTWGGVSIQGTAPDWPCPDDPGNIWGCQISPCRGSQGNSCQWRDRCVIPVAGEPAICPGGRDFLCCYLTNDG